MHPLSSPSSHQRLPPSAARRRRSTILTDTNPYPSSEARRVSTFGVPAAQLSPIPTDDDVEHALRFSHSVHMNGNTNGNMNGNMNGGSNINGGQHGTSGLHRDNTAEILGSELTQAIKLLSLDSTSSTTSPIGPDPEEILKEVIRESLQALQAFRYARHLTTQIHNSGNVNNTGMNIFYNGANGAGADADVMHVTALYDQAGSCMMSAREVLAFAEPYIKEERDRVRDELLKGGAGGC